jgi:hypothetical protein
VTLQAGKSAEKQKQAKNARESGKDQHGVRSRQREWQMKIHDGAFRLLFVRDAHTNPRIEHRVGTWEGQQKTEKAGLRR